MSPRVKTRSVDTSERALLAQVIVGDRSVEEAAESMAELVRLTDTVGAKVVGQMTQRRAAPHRAHLVGEGKVEELRLACESAGADLVIFDNDLTPMQVNNLDQALNVKVIDRTELILQIFARRARSAEAQIQVELAQLEYLVKRLPTSSKQQRFKGGIGMRGPGESPLQLRNEPMKKRMKELKRRLETIGERRQKTRGRRRWPLVCLVGYTNAGKSTLMNAFSDADAYVDDRLFATLDTKTRLVHTVGRACVMLADTVGFIRQLPHGLVASFRSTLDVVSDADLLLVVTDASHPYVEDHLLVVRETLAQIGASDVPYVLVLNKCDNAAAAAAVPVLAASHPTAVAISARTGMGLDRLREILAEKLGAAGMPAYAEGESEAESEPEPEPDATEEI